VVLVVDKNTENKITMNMGFQETLKVSIFVSSIKE